MARPSPLTPCGWTVNGAVRDVVSADLNGNGKPELYIFTDNGSANGGLYGYEFGERGYTPVASPGMISGHGRHRLHRQRTRTCISGNKLSALRSR